MEDLCHFHINYLSSSFQTFSIQSVFSIFQFIGDTTLFGDFKANMQEEKNNFQDGKEYKQ